MALLAARLMIWAAIKIVSDSLGLPTGKRGVDLQYGETSSDNESAGKTRALDEGRLISDAEYRSAYTQIRQYQPSLDRNKITDAMVRKNMEKRKAIRNN